MTKIFAIYGRVNFVKKPTWLDGFCKRYNQPYDYHITLTQCRFISDTDVSKLKEKVDKFFAPPAGGLSIPNHKIEVDFSIPIIDDEGVEKDEACIMINAKNNNQLIQLQKNLVKLMVDYPNYYKSELEEYERNFQPHITVAMDLNKIRFDQAKKDFKEDFKCIGTIDEVILSIVKEITPDESKNKDNLRVYRL